jgi:uncharacterized oxidoreductase
MNLSGNTILVTGGASGIGLGLTERFLAEGNKVAVCGRRADLLEALVAKHPSVLTFVCDLTIAAEREKLAAWATETVGGIDVLVNNAGVQNWMDLDDAAFLEKSQTEIDTNITAPLHLTWLFTKEPTLKTVMNVTSGLSFVPFTKVPVYSATKAFFHSFTLSMRHLLAPKGIEVIEIIPPALNTDLGGKGLHDAAPPVSDFIASIFEQLKSGKQSLTFGFSEMMANAGPEGIAAAFERLNGKPA